jgi:hypothetical protein
MNSSELHASTIPTRTMRCSERWPISAKEGNPASQRWNAAWEGSLTFLLAFLPLLAFASGGEAASFAFQ